MILSRYKSYIFKSLCLVLIIIINSCATEESIPVEVDFSINIVDEDYSVPVKVEIKNKTKGADNYYWEFEGAMVSSSNKKNPKPVIYTREGLYKIKLKASKRDGNEDVKEIEIQIDAAMEVDFSWEMEGSDISPVTLKMIDKSVGAKNYKWEFQGGIPEISIEKNPKVVFNTGGEHIIKLTISNGRETYSIEKKVEIMPAMEVDFEWEVDFIDEDYQAPVLLYLKNLSTNADSYRWEVIGANPSTSMEKNPDINFINAGRYTIKLEATNDKETKIIQKQITIYSNANLLAFENVKLGINTAHKTIGSFFSSHLGKVIKKGEVTLDISNKIDFAFFGLNASFNYNQFVSPNEVQSTSFIAIPNAIHTKIINSQELIGEKLSPAKFDKIKDGNEFNGINIIETNIGKTPFNNLETPRIVLFETEDGRKGAIKINDFIAEGVDSYILVDIKVQKQP